MFPNEVRISVPREGGYSARRREITPGTARRIIPYTKPYRWPLALLLSATAVTSATATATPLLIGVIIDDGIIPRKINVVITLALILVGLAVLDGILEYIQTRCSAWIGQGLILNLRNQVFNKIREQPIAFFTRSQTGSLVSRLNSDVIMAQQAITSLLSQSLSTGLTLILVLGAMFYLSWQITIAALVIAPLFALPGKFIGTRLQRYTRQQMQLNAEASSLMSERFNVAGAMLSKLYGRPDEEASLFASVTSRLRDAAVKTSVYGRVLNIFTGGLSTVILAVTFGLGGYLAIHGHFEVGSLVALITLFDRLFGPINQVSSLQASAMTSMVSFDRIFEVLDLKPLVTERPGALALPDNSSSNGTAPEIEFDHVSFRYPTAKDVSLPSLESIVKSVPERDNNTLALSEVSFRVRPGKLTALVGPSGAGKTTITQLVPRLYDPVSGTVRIDGHNVADLTMQSLHDTVGVITQDAHLFHDTIRSNLLYARPGATERELIEACEAAQIWELISSLPEGLDSVVGDRGHRLSGGEKQRVALARLLLKAPRIVVLDEATAHLDSESEAAVQRALKIALAGRTSLVIAHRLSTIREADQILVLDAGQISERGNHEELLAAGGLYADLYRTQFAKQTATGDESGGGSAKPVNGTRTDTSPQP